ncbi:type VII secretion protein EccC [Pseudonocardia spinosispora]|uniref:type VII secretion protein EccC n=1 Tax=Pseudonocardia spinosispora TaxID=103441 RepID=UPI00048F3C03|nr:type VII secretion protein EccC [Pseudonocardia spinosispora]
MSVVAFHRPARTFPPSVPEQRVSLPAPPQKPQDNQSQTWLYVLLPLLSSVSMAAYLISAGRAWMMALGILFVFLSVGVTIWVRTSMRRQGDGNIRKQRDRYLEYLDAQRLQAEESAAAQRAVAAFLHPSPRRLWALVTGRRRVWERRPGDTDFLLLRLGIGRGTPVMRLELARRGDPIAELESESQAAAEQLTEDYSTVSRQPACVDLANVGVLSLQGPPEAGTALLGALLMQLAVLHAPDDVRVVAMLTGPDSELNWAKWLPHARMDGFGEAPLVSDSWEGISDVLAQRLERAQKERTERSSALAMRREATPGEQLVLLLDGYRPDSAWARDELLENLLAEAGPASGIHVVCVVTKEREEPSRVDARARLTEDGGLVLESRDPKLVSTVTLARPDVHPRRLSEQTARALSPLKLSGEREQVLSRNIALPEMLGVPDIGNFDPTTFWRAPDDEALLRLPIGVTGEGETLTLDLKESAQGGIGPHGLIVGATGSGKSELLRTLVTGLTITHAPDQLSFVLVDFKGGATFAGVTELPHVAGLITNLADDLALVDRMRAALHGEQQRRQKMLREAGDVDSVLEYQIRCAAGVPDSNGRPLEPMPYLMIIVDEFGELLSQRPDFIDLFVQIGRVGRSLGMHLLLATQRLEEGRLRGLDSHLSYRICLRTFSPGESRAVIGTPDAYRLPSIPGSAYLKVDESIYERFRVAHVSGTYTDAVARAVVAPRRTPEPVEFGLRSEQDAGKAEERELATTAATTLTRPAPGQRTEMAVAVAQVMAHGSAVHQVWLPPLPNAIELDSLVAPVGVDAERGLSSTLWPAGARLTFPVGVLDLPAQQEQRALLLDLSGMHGHLVVVGAPQSGKSTLLRSALLGAMLTHTPDELQFLGVDFGGGTLVGLEEAPHVRGVATRLDEARTRRALAVARQLVEQRERLFAALRIDSVEEFRRMRDARELPDGTNAADVVIAIDNWAALRASVEDADEIVNEIAGRGLGIGVHLVLTANRWGELRAALRDNITGRLELRLNEPSESELSRPAAKQLHNAAPGRGIVAPGHIFHTALPRLDGQSSTDNLAVAQREVVRALAANWPGEPAPELRVLPELITQPELDKACAEFLPGGVEALPATAVPIGLREVDLEPDVVDLAVDNPHFLVLGDSGSGKTNFLRTWMAGLARRTTAWQTRFVLVDYRRGLFDAVGEEYLGAVATDPDSVAGYVAQVAAKMKERIPPPGVTPAQLRERSWWSGPEIYLVMDDYDLVGSPALREPMLELSGYLAQATDLGLHLVLSRRVGGMSRALMGDALVSRLHDLGTGGLILSGDPREGALIGDQRARPQEPGRGVLMSRQRGARLVQLVHEPPTT